MKASGTGIISYEWLEWAKRIQALSQTGLTYSKDIYDIERYEELRKISVEIMSEYTELEMKKMLLFFFFHHLYYYPQPA